MEWTRRDFVRTSSLCLVASALPRPLLAAADAGPGLAAHGPGELVAADFQELRGGAGLFTDRGGTIGWLVNDDGALVVDSQYPQSAQALLSGLQDRAAERLDAVINTHHHGDHTAGNGVLAGAADRIVAHRRVPELQRAAAGPDGGARQTFADTTFDTEWTLTLGSERVRAKHYGPAHTGGDATVLFEQAGVVHMGDLVFNGAYPFIDRDGGASIRGWIATLEAVAGEHEPETIFIFGHAAPGASITGDRIDLLGQRDFLSAVLETAMGAVDAGWSREETTAQDELPGFEHYVALSDSLDLASALGAAYDEVASDT